MALLKLELTTNKDMVDVCTKIKHAEYSRHDQKLKGLDELHEKREKHETTKHTLQITQQDLQTVKKLLQQANHREKVANLGWSAQ